MTLGSDELIVGACWTGEKNLLVTSSSSVRVYHVDHVQEPLRTWNFRPDQQHALTSPAVFVGRSKKSRGGFTAAGGDNNQAHQRPSIVSIQNMRTLISWDHDDEALTTLKSLALPVSSNQLLGSCFPDVVVVVGTNGDIMCYDPTLKSVGALPFKVDDEHSTVGGEDGPASSKRTKSRSTSRARRRSRSNSSLSSTVGVQRSSDDEPTLEWAVHWAKHAPVHKSKDKTTVLLYVLLRKTDDASAPHLLVVHELTRDRGKLRISTLSQRSIGGVVKAATLGVSKKSNSDRALDICLQMVCCSAPDGDDEDTSRGDYFQVMTFPNGPRNPSKMTSRRRLSNDQAVNSTSKKNSKSSTAGSRKRRRRGGAEEEVMLSASEVVSQAPYAVVAISSQHSVIARVEGSSSSSSSSSEDGSGSGGGVRCIGWDSKFSVPINELFVPCHMTADAGSNVHMVLCPDGVTLALIGATTLVVYATRCAEPSLASVLGCGRGLPSESNTNNGNGVVSLLVNGEAELAGSFSRTTGAAAVSKWSIEKGTFSERGRQEDIALGYALEASDAKKFNECVLAHLSATPLLSHNYVRAVVDACHKFGPASWPALTQMLNTGRVSAWSCPMLIDTLLVGTEGTTPTPTPAGKKTKGQKKTKQEVKRMEKTRMLLLEATLHHVQDLHEEAIVRLLRYVVGRSKADYEDVDGLLRAIVSTPYNGSFLRSFLRSMTITETRFILKFLHHIIRVETQKPSVAVAAAAAAAAASSSSSSSSKKNKKTTLNMAQAVGWTTMILDAHFQSIVMEGRHNGSKMDSVLRALSDDVHELIDTCRTFTLIKAQVNHLSKSTVLPYTPIPSYSIEVLNAFTN